MSHAEGDERNGILMDTTPVTEGKVVSLINMKGGVGKTTLAVGLAWELAKDNDVLLVDVDPQFNATQWLVDGKEYLGWLKSESKHTVFDIFLPQKASPGIGGFSKKGQKKKDATIRSAIMQVKHDGTTLDIVPSDLELMTLDAAPRGTENRLNLFLKQARKKYKFIIIDCPPTASLFSLSAHIASDAYLVPIKPDPLSVLGLPLLERTIASYADRTGHTTQRLGLVLTLVRSTQAMRSASRQVRSDYSGEVYAAQIKQTTGVAEAVDKGLPLQLFHKTRNHPDIPLAKITGEFVERVKGL